MRVWNQGEIKAFNFALFFFIVIIFLAFYNLIAKAFFDPCCRVNTLGERLIEKGKYFSYFLGIIFLFLIVFTIFKKQVFDRIHKESPVSLIKKENSMFNGFFILLLLIDLFFLFFAQLPQYLIGCTYCKA